MRAQRLSFGLLGTLALAGLPAPVGAQPVGSEFQINTYTTASQQTRGGDHLVAMDASGNFVVVWKSSGQDGSGDGVFGQRYDSAGGVLGTEFRVNSFTTNQQSYPSVTSDASGNFVVVWRSYRQDDNNYGIFGQRYDNDGEPQGAEFHVNSYTPGFQLDPSVASDANGNFVVVWGSNGDIVGERYDSEGVPQGGEFLVNTTTTGSSAAPSVASDAHGDFVVVWGSYVGYGYPAGIFGQRYDNEGVPQGTEFRVDSVQGSSPSIASDPNGNFVVVWYDNGNIFGQRYDNAGGTRGSEFRVNSYLPGVQSDPSVASDASGNFMVAWTSPGQDGDADAVFGQRYDSGGVAQGDELQINLYTTGQQERPSVGATGVNQFVIAWESADTPNCPGPGQDGNCEGVFGRRLSFDGDTITVVSPNTNVKWRIGSLQRIQWTHNVGVGATFRIELDRNDDGTYEELITADAPADNAARGTFAWTVTGPPSGTARVRVSWTDDVSVSDSSDATFQIRPAN